MISSNFSPQKAQQFMARFNENLDEVYEEYNNSPYDDDPSDNVDVMTGRDEVLIMKDPDGTTYSANFQYGFHYHTINYDYSNNTSTYTMDGNGKVESAVLNKEGEIIDFRSQAKGPMVSLPGRNHSPGPYQAAMVSLA